MAVVLVYIYGTLEIRRVLAELNRHGVEKPSDHEDAAYVRERREQVRHYTQLGTHWPQSTFCSTRAYCPNLRGKNKLAFPNSGIL